MHIWLISAFEPTPIDNTRPMRFMSIADAALKRGHKVTFFTTTFKHNNKSQRFEQNSYHTVQNEKYELVFIHSKPYSKNISFERMMAHNDLAEKLVSEIKHQQKKPDIIYISLPPLSTVEKVCKWAKENDVPLIVDIIDPWPDVFLKIAPASLQGIAKLPLQPLYAKLRYIMKNCSGVAAISEQYINWAKPFGINGKRSAHFYPAVQLDEVKNAFAGLEATVKKNKDKLRIIYAGSLSSSYDIPTILAAAELLEKKYPSKTEFAIAGTGPQESLIKESSLKNVTYLGWLNQEDIYREFYLSDLGLTQHVKGATQSVTYKLFDYLSAGLPILNSLDSEMASIISDNKVGFNNKSHDEIGLAENIERFLKDRNLLEEYRQNAIDLTAAIGDSKIVYNQLLDFIETIKEESTAGVA
jgi:glycosyltransferase involved in cell wall biosynthesis